MPKCTTCSKRRKKTGRCPGCRELNKVIRRALREDEESELSFERRRIGEREARLTVKVHRGMYG